MATTKAPAARTAAGRKPAAEAKTDRTATIREQHPCRCGCGQQVARTFAVGHDARHLSNLRKAVAAGTMTADAALGEARTVSTAFAGKVARSLAAVARDSERAAAEDRSQDAQAATGGVAA